MKKLTMHLALDLGAPGGRRKVARSSNFVSAEFAFLGLLNQRETSWSWVEMSLFANTFLQCDSSKLIGLIVLQFSRLRGSLLLEYYGDVFFFFLLAKEIFAKFLFAKRIRMTGLCFFKGNSNCYCHETEF